MAGQWIKWERGLVRKAEVIRIARALNSTPQHAAACCMQVWEWGEDQTTDGTIRGLAIEDVDMAVGVPGIGEAMLDAEWLRVSDVGIVFPHWDRHNAEPAKARALDALRKRVTRMEDKTRTLNGRVSGSQPDISRTNIRDVHR